MKNYVHRTARLTLLLSFLCHPTTQSPQETWITIFVHGIMSIKPHISATNFLRFMTDDVHNTVYSKTVELMRNDPIFFQNQAMQEPGLKAIECQSQQCKGNASAALASTFEHFFARTPHHKEIKNYYYTFGWSGLLSAQQRSADAQELFKALEDEVEKFRSHMIEPKIRLVGYSHGGNVCLNVAHAAPETNTPFTIDELVLVGMPVQHETAHLIHHPVFKKIYHIYSRGDRIQKLDFFSFNRFFSRRIFKEKNNLSIPPKLCQIQLKFTRYHKYLSDTNKASLLSSYNFYNDTVVGGKSRYFRNACPGHTELWFFGWTPVNYRDHFPIYPLPAIALLPFILTIVDLFPEHDFFNNNKPLLIDIRPEQELILLKNQKFHNVVTVLPFLSREELEEIQRLALSYAPDNYTHEIYTSRITDAHQKAKEHYRSDRAKYLRSRRNYAKNRV